MYLYAVGLVQVREDTKDDSIPDIIHNSVTCAIVNVLKIDRQRNEKHLEVHNPRAQISSNS